jgi:hypothetical protein
MISPVFDIEWRSAVAVAARCGEEGFRAARRFPLLLPLLPWLVVRAGTAWWLGGFPVPPRDHVAVLWEQVGGEAATHFPETSAVLPRLVAWLDPGLEFVLGVFGVMWVCALLPEVFRGQPLSMKAARSRLGWRMGGAWIAAFPGIVGSGVLLIAADTFRWLPMFGEIVHAAAIVLAVLCRAFFVYAVAAVILGGTSPAKAWRRSTVLAGQFLAPTLAFVLVTFLVCWPWRPSPDLVLGLFGRFPPEWTGPWVAIGALPLTLATLFVTAATTRLYLHGYGAGGER